MWDTGPWNQPFRDAEVTKLTRTNFSHAQIKYTRKSSVLCGILASLFCRLDKTLEEIIFKLVPGLRESEIYNALQRYTLLAM